jgi:hypothetical protein
MDIKTIDKNFDTSFVAPDDIEWFSIREMPFSVHGVFYSEEEGLYRRLPKDVADATNEGVSYLSTKTAGGRVRFATDSPYVVVRVEARGDKNIYLIDCYGCFGAPKNGECGTVDGLHPDSLGFLRMAQRVYPVLNRLLNADE